VPRPDEQELRSAVAAADLRVLLMSLVHITGDLRWLQAPYLPKRDVRLVADPDAGLAPEVQDEIRSAIVELMRDRRPTPRIDDPGRDLFSRMMNACLGEIVPDEYITMVREDMGFESGDVQWHRRDHTEATSTFATDVDIPVLLIGAGISGMGLSVHLARLGIGHRIVEKNAAVGGTWFENRYPGCGVDTPNQFYSYSRAANVNWSYYFSPRDELQAYLEDFADKYEIRKRTDFNTEVIAADWDDSAKIWRTTVRDTAGVRQITSKVLVSAIGHFNRPNDIPFRGTDTFEGEVFHSARWPEGLDLAGKRVALVGTGASSVQIAPAIADKVRSLTIYQRSPQWVREVPGLSSPVPAGTPWLLENIPYYAQWNRFTLFWRYGDGLLQWLRKDPEWPTPELSLNRVNDRHRQETTRYIHAELAERPDLIEKCVPTYPPYGKRILLDKDWYKTLVRANVELITDPIDRLEGNRVVVKTGGAAGEAGAAVEVHREADVVIMALGFSVTDLAARLNVTGRNGVRLADAWADDNPRAYLGITVPDFPNFFCMYGPNTNTGHGGSVFLLAESQSRYITGCITALIEGGAQAMECKRAALDEYIDRMDAEHEHLVWTHPGMTTYYRNRHGRIVSVMPWRLVDYWAMTHEPDPADFILA
jgi:4-hydroxyacetophenone monooxygenase